MVVKSAKFNIGQAVRHRHYDFGGLIVDVDPVFSEDNERLTSVPPSQRPDPDQPFYRVNVDDHGVKSTAYVSEGNLLADETGIYAADDAYGATSADDGDVYHGMMH